MQSLPALRLDHTTQTLLLTTYFMTNLSRICTLLECLRTANPMSENNYLNMLNIIIVLALAPRTIFNCRILPAYDYSACKVNYSSSQK